MAGEVIRVALLTWLTERHKEDLTYTRAASRFPFDAAAASAAALTMASRKCLFFFVETHAPRALFTPPQRLRPEGRARAKILEKEQRARPKGRLRAKAPGAAPPKPLRSRYFA